MSAFSDEVKDDDDDDGEEEVEGSLALEANSRGEVNEKDEERGRLKEDEAGKEERDPKEDEVDPGEDGPNEGREEASVRDGDVEVEAASSQEEARSPVT